MRGWWRGKFSISTSTPPPSHPPILRLTRSQNLPLPTITAGHGRFLIGDNKRPAALIRPVTGGTVP